MAEPDDSHLPDAVFDALPARLAVVNAKGRIVRINQAWRQSHRPLPGPGTGFADVYDFVKHQPRRLTCCWPACAACWTAARASTATSLNTTTPHFPAAGAGRA